MRTRSRSLCFLTCAAALSIAAARLESSEPRFQRGDADGNGVLQITDGVRVLVFLFQGGLPPACLDSADVDDNGSLQITDAVRVLSFLFRGGPPPAPPFPDCGLDATPATGMSCHEESATCATPLDEFGALAASFGILDTIAGKGESDSGNEWDLVFEGGPAVDAELSRPHNALGDDAGNIYIADKESHAIRAVTPDGSIVTVAGTNAPGDGSDEPGPGTERALGDPNGIWVLGDGTVYILDLDNEKVRRLSPAGELTTLFKVPGLVLGRGLWVASDESLAYVASGSELKRWTPSGGVTTLASGFSQLANLAFDATGDVLVTDQGLHRAFRVRPDGSSEAIAGNGTTTGGGSGQPALQTGLNEVRGIWLLESGGYFLATHRGSQVWYVDTQGVIHLFLDGGRNAHSGDGEPYDTPGQKVSEVRSVTMDPRGNLLVTESDEGSIRIVRRK